MKVGDLVKWTYPGHEDHGVVVGTSSNLDGYWNIPDGYAHIIWCKRPEYSGAYPMGNTYLKLISKSP